MPGTTFFRFFPYCFAWHAMVVTTEQQHACSPLASKELKACHKFYVTPCCVYPQVELQFGAVYDKYRYSCYYWECIVLLEAFLLTLMLVMLQTQNNAALQVLVAMAIMFLEAVLHVSSGGDGKDDLMSLRCIR